MGRVNNGLVIARLDQDQPMHRPARLLPVGERRFVVADNDDFGRRGEEVVFDLDRSGRATAMWSGAAELRRVDS